MSAVHVNTAWAAPPRLPVGRGQGGFRQGTLQQKQLKKLSNCTNSAPGMRGAREAWLYLLFLAPTGTTWNKAGGIQVTRGRRREAFLVVEVQGEAPAPQENGQAQAGANGCAPSSRLGQH